jgi:nitronate monooxygenase
MTAPIRAAAAEREDPNGINLWAGTAFQEARSGPAADIVASLASG